MMFRGPRANGQMWGLRVWRQACGMLLSGYFGGVEVSSLNDTRDSFRRGPEKWPCTYALYAVSAPGRYARRRPPSFTIPCPPTSVTYPLFEGCASGGAAMVHPTSEPIITRHF